ncbi:MAG: pyrroline-5-carboxylate reductase [Gemmatimonadota bacterium]
MRICFVGGGNMAAALIGGLLRAGTPRPDIRAIEVDAARRDHLQRELGVAALPAPDASVAGVDVIVLAVKPQQMRDACRALQPFVRAQLVLSIAAGIRARDLARWLNTQCVVRAMPNTPALVGKGISGAAATAGVSDAQRQMAESILHAAGSVVWVADDGQLDAVTALSGSGPAYVFYFIEALIDAARAMGFDAAQARQFAVETVTGAAHLAAASADPLETLRARVTSKGGTTAAAIARMEADGLKQRIVDAVLAARKRAAELGDEFGRD